MTDNIDKLKKAFDVEPEIKASERTKKTAMIAAMQAFEKEHELSNVKEEIKDTKKENSNNLQGNSIDTRLKDEDNIQGKNNVGLFNLSYWRKLMKLSYLFPVAAAGTLAVSVLVLNPHLFRKSQVVDISYKDDSLLIKENKASNEKLLDFENRYGGSASDMDSSFSEDSNITMDSVSPQIVQGEVPQQPSSIGNDKKKIPTGHVARQTAKQLGYRAAASSGKIGQIVESSIGWDDQQLVPPAEGGRDKFESIKTNPLKFTNKEPVSTFSIDVDTASYSYMRAAINRNRLPQKNAVRVEEFINYFPYDYPASDDLKQPFQVSTTVMPTPWNANTKLLHIGIKGYKIAKQENPKSNLVFLLDTSGSMNEANKLPLLINSFKLLLSSLQADDTVSIVAYAGSAGTVLEPTKVKEKLKITQALERLQAGGSTAGGRGIHLAYQLAEANYDKKAVNRVILATDGDFNVGIRSHKELESFIERKRKSGVFLSVLGFGMGNYNDALMQTLAQNGNGNAAYIDSLSEARKVLVEEASSTLFTIAKDVKIQMEFNPKAVSEYRLIGYETRALKREDFNNDKVDAGDIGAGHTVTAIYEITPTGSESKSVEPLRYGEQKDEATPQKQTEYGFLKLRYKLPNEDKSKLIEKPVLIADTYESIDSTSNETRFPTAVAAFGQLLRGGTYTKSYSSDDIIKLAQGAKGQDPYGYRAEFITLVRLAKSIQVIR